MVRDSVLRSIEVQLVHQAAEDPIYGPVIVREPRRPGDERGPDPPSSISRGTKCTEYLVGEERLVTDGVRRGDRIAAKERRSPLGARARGG